MNNNRIDQDIIGLIKNNHVVQVKNRKQFTVLFNGPSETPYENGIWIICVAADDEYPFKPPFVKFKTPIYHPNIDSESGSICMNVLHENWSPIYNLLNIFEQFLPQLLKYPNPDDPLNMHAAKLLLHKPAIYEQRVLKYVQLYAQDTLSNNDVGDGVTENNDKETNSISDGQVHGESMANKVD